MFSKFRIALGMTLILVFAFVIPAFAGGWAVITLDEMPAGIVAGEPLMIGFTVMQHGKTPMNDLTPTITASLLNGQEFVVTAEHDEEPGHYTATLTFPKEGEWNWSIQAFTMDQPMPVLNVAASTTKVTSQPEAGSQLATASMPVLMVIRLSALGLGLIGFVFAFRRRSRFAMALLAICLLVGVGSFVAAPAIPAVEAKGESLSNMKREISSISQVELGQELFVSKGCVTCHVNNKVEQVYVSGVVNGAPDLTNFSASPESLKIWLEDPAAVKPSTWMPDLHLTSAEIEALIAFINSN